MNSFLTITKNIFFVIFVSSCFASIVISDFEKTVPILSFTQQFQLDFIHQEIHQYPELFINEWTNNSNVELIIESAELAVQNSSSQTKTIMKQRIIKLFSQINIPIQFTDEDLIIKIDLTKSDLLFKFNDHKHHHKLKKHRPLFKKNNSMKLPELQKIKGARRTLRRIKKELSDKEKAIKELELTNIRRKTAHRENSPQYIKKTRQDINPLELWPHRLKQEYIDEREIFPTQLQNEQPKEHEIA